MKIFFDTANRNTLKKLLDSGIVDGVTTNPTQLSKEDGDTKKVLLDICSMVPGDVSIEVVEKEPEAVYRQARETASLAPNIVIKIPFAFEYLPVIKRLVAEGVPVNVTLIFSLTQALLVAKLGVKYISPFIGRWDDIDVDGLKLIHELVQIRHNYHFSSLILATSLRSIMQVHNVALAGVDVAAITPDLITNLTSHPTIQGIGHFEADWKKSGKRAFS